MFRRILRSIRARRDIVRRRWTVYRAVKGRHLAETLEGFDARWPDPSPPDDDPLFLLAAGWRSGSTFLQRLTVGSGDRIVWGEPFQRSEIVQRMAEQLRPFVARWPAESLFLDDQGEAEIVDEFIAMLYPEADALRQAHRAYFDRLFAQPARERGFSHWGLKEVRLRTEHAAYLRWLYPRARFVFLVRNPYDAWLSYRPWRGWFWSWPDDMVNTPTQFGRHWRDSAEDFLRHHERVGGLLIRYEELHEPATIARLEQHVGHSLPPPERLARVGGARERDHRMPALEERLLRARVGEAAQQLGYIGPSR